MKVERCAALLMVVAGCRVPETASPPPSPGLPFSAESSAPREAASWELVELWRAKSSNDELDFGGSVVSVGDIDRDGVRDVVVAAPPVRFDLGRVYVLSGDDGSVLDELRCMLVEPGRSQSVRHTTCNFGGALCAIGDVDGDGVDDFAVGDAYLEPINRYPPFGVWIFSSASRKILHSIVVDEPSGYGVQLAAPGDIDRDGAPDLLVLAWGQISDCVDAISGRTGERIYRTLLNEGTFTWLARELAVVEDANGDDVRDFIAWRSFRGLEPQTRLWLFSGVDGAPLFELATWTPSSHAQAEAVARTCGDMDGDGIIDLLRRGLHGMRSTTEIASGVDLRTLMTFEADSSHLEALGDLDGDGSMEFSEWTHEFADTVRVMSVRRVPKVSPSQH